MSALSDIGNQPYLGKSPPLLHRAPLLEQEHGGIQLPPQPPMLPGHTVEGMVDKLAALVLRERGFVWWYLLMLPALLFLLTGLCSAFWLLYKGPGVWGINWPVMWGFALVNYVWWIGLSNGGTFVSAFFYVTRADWRPGVSRIAEFVMLLTAAPAGIYPILHLGRPWFFYWLFPYPDTLLLWPQWRSPLFWDFCSIFTYVVSIAIYFYMGLIPDLATVRDRARRRFAQIFYGVLALGFRGKREEWRRYRATYAVMAAVMASLVVVVHSFVANDFSGAQTTGWHATEFPPYFVIGAIHSGFAAVVFLMLPLRRLQRLQSFITGRHLDVLGRLMIASSWALGYMYLMDSFNSYYAQDPSEHVFASYAMWGHYRGIFWSRIALLILLPQLFWFRFVRLNQIANWVISFGIIVGMWLDSFETVIVSLSHGKIPSSWGYFYGTVWDWTLFWGTVGLFATGFLLAIRLLPPISIHDLAQLMRWKQP
jgi:Ni/Fe-hydrogenase subunit HybB-like protein